MEDHQNMSSGGRREEWPRHSPSVERLSRLPMHRWSCRQADPEPNGWSHDPFTSAILHDTDICSVCKGYFDHYHRSMRQKSPSMEDTLEERTSLTVPSREHKRLYAKYEEHMEDGCEMFDELKSTHANYDALKRQFNELTEKHESLLCSQIVPPPSFKWRKVTSEQVIEPAQRTMRPLPMREMPPSTVRQSAVPLPPVMAAPPAVAPTQPIASTSRSADPYVDLSDDLDNELTNPGYWREVKESKTLPLVNLLAALARDFQSGNHFHQGRDLQIDPQNEAEFKLVMDHLNIHHDEWLLAATRKYIGELQVIPSGVRSPYQKAILQTWRQPSWVKHKMYDKTLGKVVFSEKTIDEMKTDGGLTHLQRQQVSIATKLKLEEFDPWLGNVGSPQHGDHPLVWAHYLRFFAGPNNIARGLTAGVSRWISQRVIRQFLRI